ncbi:hypothetical protein DICPUDRAFT_86132 [Dictyostelium purpureum]|uniref:NACHT domain-containing protein n=1 Tax=Dictyostelium purpureum TaxID=5786 RepID=F0Z9P2_DICPU|nr:uncharacterized protein DICPUDRAFT_86132 [Dictyostelium purpureum]EGC39334.1 hypothetical protein DICPUDRAFT_86132 [Dictyostelium purpureum]|eukprot:XP_003284122.1 hypothetical protein DICPUDRAFT_86132 [Dictyostelium purpureum]
MVKVEFPNEELSKYDIQKWLKSYKIAYSPFMKKEELLEVVKSNRKIVINIEKEKKKQLKSEESGSTSTSTSISVTTSPYKTKSLESPFKKFNLKNNLSNQIDEKSQQQLQMDLQLNGNDSEELEKLYPNLKRHDKAISNQKVINDLHNDGTRLYVFLSSTFKDMSGERDHLIKVVFPALNVKAKEKNLTIVPIDLRWGLTKDETNLQGQIELCLKQIDKCPIMVTMLGSRFGWVAEEYKVSNNNDEQAKWLQSMPPGHSITSLEVQYSLINSKHCIGTFRDPSFQSTVPLQHQSSFQVENSESEILLNQLKQKLIDSDNCNVLENYPCKFGGVDKDGKVFVNQLEVFGNYVFNKIWEIVQVEFSSPIKSLEFIEIENQYHKDILEIKSNNFYGRELIQKKINDTLQEKQTNNLISIIYGDAGSGKTSTLSNLAKNYLKDPQLSKHWKVLYHFIGCSIDSTASQNILYRFSNELNIEFKLGFEVVAQNPEKLRNDFPDILKKASKHKKILIVIDDLDQMATLNQDHQMDWLPDNSDLNSNIRVLLSCHHGKDCWEYLHLRPVIPQTFSLSPLETNEKILITTNTLEKFSKKLEPKLLDKLITKSHAKYPLFIQLACEELRVFGSFEKLTQFVQKGIPETINQLLLNMISRLEEDLGKELIKKTLCFIALSRFGLSEQELLDLLKDKKQQTTLPFYVWAPLLNSISPLLSGGDHSVRISFFHSTISSVIINKYLPTEKSQINFQIILADYYSSQADPTGNKTWAGTNLKALKELPYHLQKSKRWDLLSQLFMDLKFIQTKVQLGLSDSLVENYIDCLEEINSPSLSGERWVGANFSSVNNFSDFSSFVQYQIHNLKRFPAITSQQAYNLPDGSICHQYSSKLLDQEKRPFFKWLNKLQLSDYIISTLAGHKDFIRCVLYRDDGKLIASCSDDTTIRIWSGETGSLMRVFPQEHNDKVTQLIWRGNHLITVGRDKKIIMWDEYGKIVLNISDLGGNHISAIWGVTVSGDNRRCVTASWDHSCIVWDLENKTKLFDLKDHKNKVSACCYSHNNRWIATGCWDGNLIIWDAKNGTPIKTIKISNFTILFIHFSPDDSMLSVSSVDTFTHVFNTSKWEKIAKLEGHVEAVISSRFSYDNQYIVSCSDDKTIRVFETKDWSQVSLMTGHSGRIISCAFHPNSSKLRIITGATDKFIKIWDPKIGQKTNSSIQGHKKSTLHLQYFKEKDILLSCSEDQTFAVWSDFSKNDLLQPSKIFKIHIRKFHFYENNLIFLTNSNDIYHLSNFDQFFDGRFDGNHGFQRGSKQQDQHSEQITNFSVNPSNNGDIAITTKGGKLIIYNFIERKELFNERLGGSLSECVYNSTGDLLISRDTKGYYNIFKQHQPMKYSCIFKSNAPQPITAMAWSSNHFALALMNGDIELYTIRPVIHLWKTLKNHVFQVHGLSFSPKGKYLFSASYEKHSILWDVETSQVVTAFPLGSISTSNVVFYIDNFKQLSTVVSDYTGKIHNLRILHNEENYYDN